MLTVTASLAWALLRGTAIDQEVQFVTIDPAFEARLGPNAQNIIGRKLFDFIQPGNQAHQQRGVASILAKRYKDRREARDWCIDMTPIP